jgi:two-component system, NtrC family, response regulator AtoC
MDWTQALDHDKAAGWSKGEDQHFVPSTSPTVRPVEELIANIAATDFPVLVMGESGSGKEAVALRIHRRSLRNHEPFIKVVCGALSSEFFETLRRDAEGGNGHSDTPSIGTLFLDEIVELALPSQASLLQAFPDGEIIPQGHFLSARIISATSRTPEELEQALDRGGLRKDLFYRLNGVCLRLPPLRERKEDIPALVEFFLRKNALALGRPQPSLGSRALQIMQQYAWPGNIRELENVVRRMVAVGSDSAVSDLGSLATAARESNDNGEKLSLKQTSREASRHAEKELILKVLSRTHWNRKRAAQQLQISYKALLYKLRQMGLDGSETL